MLLATALAGLGPVNVAVEMTGVKMSDQAVENFRTGPAVGELIPAFEAPDQNGMLRNFDSIKGPRGAVILFHRSADW